MPNSRVNRVESAEDGSLRVRLTAPAVDGKANAALTRFLADQLDVSRSSIQILSGEHHRNKVIGVVGLTPNQVHTKLLDKTA